MANSDQSLSLGLRSIGGNISNPTETTPKSSNIVNTGLSVQCTNKLNENKGYQIDFSQYENIGYEVDDYLEYTRRITTLGLNFIGSKDFYFGGAGLGVLKMDGKLKTTSKAGLTITTDFADKSINYGYFKAFGGLKYSFNSKLSIHFKAELLFWPQKDGDIHINDNGVEYQITLRDFQVAAFSTLGLSYHF